MNPFPSILCRSLLCLFAIFLPGLLTAADANTNPAGHWEGAITLPTTALGVRVDLERGADQSWQGTIDIPVQGLRGFKLDPVKVDGAVVDFGMPGIPGNPEFAGRLATEGKSMAGDFTQGGQKFPFKLERKARPATSGLEIPLHGVPGKELAGHWLGAMKVSAVMELRLALDIRNSAAGKLEGAMTSLDQGNALVPITALTETAGTVHLETKSIGGMFDGKLSDDGSELAGTWQQGGQKMPLVFKRVARAAKLERPQEPKPPFPYEAEEVVVENSPDGVKLAGTLTRPRGTGPFPAVILITGSGAQDRDEALMGHRPFLVLADYLTRRGIAVLRCDDRGTAKSTGDFSKATDDDFVGDTLAQVSYLLTRKEIDPRHIGLVGHSEGGVIAPIVATKSTHVHFIVLLAGVGVPLEELLLRQGRDLARVMGLSEAMMATNAAVEREIFHTIKTEPDPAKAEAAVRKVIAQQTAAMTTEQREAIGFSDATIEAQVKMVLSPWFRKLLVYDPRPTLKAVKCPVLALNGEKDLQVAAQENLPAIRAALNAGGNERVKTVELPGLNHLFQDCQTGAIAEYGQIEETFSPAAMKIISDWIHEVTAP
jgi:uncharacterized protein